MPFIDELRPDSRIFALFVSRSGAGKTTAAASFPKPEIMDFDGRVRGLTVSQSLLKHRVAFEQFLPGRGWSDIDRHLESRMMESVQRINRFETEIFDSLTSFLSLMLNEGIDLQQGKVVKRAGAKSGLRIAGPGDYNYEASAVYQGFDTLRGLSRHMNVIVTAHIIPRYSKPYLRDSGGSIIKAPDGENLLNPYAEAEEVGEKLAVRDKIEANTMIFFDEVYRFEKEQTAKGNKHWVQFDGDLARSALGLKGKHDITGKNFYDFWKEEVAKLGVKLETSPVV